MLGAGTRSELDSGEAEEDSVPRADGHGAEEIPVSGAYFNEEGAKGGWGGVTPLVGVIGQREPSRSISEMRVQRGWKSVTVLQIGTEAKRCLDSREPERDRSKGVMLLQFAFTRVAEREGLGQSSPSVAGENTQRFSAPKEGWNASSIRVCSAV